MTASSNLDLPRPPTVRTPRGSGVRPTLVPAERSLADLYTGGWRRRLSGLPSAVGRPLARWADRGRAAVPSPAQRRSERIAAHR